jgi:caa(3)-type oxidase subunit IV
VSIWVWLVVLVFGGLAAAYLPMTRTTVLLLIFEIAFVKATLVARYYMHLRGEQPLIYAIAGVPVLLAIGMVLTLVPDIVLGK